KGGERKMDPMKLAEVVQQAVRAGLPGLPYWALLAFLLAAATGAGSLIGAYLRQRGANLATKADFDSLLSQLKQNTEATERIKSAIAKEEWTEKEAVALRRVKLEDLMTNVYGLTVWARQCTDYFFLSDGRKAPPNANPLAQACMLARL